MAILLTFSVIFLLPTTILAMDYSLPRNINPNDLKRSSVIIRNGAIGTGIAVSERHVLTAAHSLLGHKLAEIPVQLFTFDSPKKCYYVPAVPHYKDEFDEDYFNPNFTQHPQARELTVKQIFFHPKTHFEKYKASSVEEFSVEEIKQKLSTVLQHGLKSGEAFCTQGIFAKYHKINKDGNLALLMGKVHGPDMAIIECKNPHGLPFLEVLSPLSTAEKTLIHILGLAGRRYENHESTQICAGVPKDSDNGVVYPYKPTIYGQRFKCVPGYEDNLHIWMNRVFLKKLTNETFLMDDQVYPDAPKDFGLIAAGDSGAGAIVIRDGKPYLVGVVSTGEISPVFSVLQRALSEINFNPVLAERQCLSDLLSFYKAALNETERDKKWFITQSLSDLTHIKPWIDDITK